MNKKLLSITVFFTFVTFLICSCSNFLNGSELKQELNTTLENVSKPEVTGFIPAYNSTGSNSNVIITIKFSSPVSIPQNKDFYEIKDSEGTDLKDYYSDPSISEDGKTLTFRPYSQEIKKLFTESSKSFIDIYVVLDQKKAGLKSSYESKYRIIQIEDNEKPVLTDVKLSRIIEKKEDNIEVWDIDDSEDIENIIGHRAKSVWITVKGFDTGSGINKVRITETLVKSVDGANVDSVSYSGSYENFVQVEDNIFECEKFEYNFKSPSDGIVRLEFDLIDCAGIQSEHAAAFDYYVLKDTDVDLSEADINTSLLCGDTSSTIPDGPSGIVDKQFNNSNINDETLKSNRIRITFNDGLSAKSSKYYSGEDNKDKIEYYLSWGSTQETLDETVELTIDENSHIGTHKIEVKDPSKPTYVRVKGIDDVGNEKYILRCIPGVGRYVYPTWRETTDYSTNRIYVNLLFDSSEDGNKEGTVTDSYGTHVPKVMHVFYVKNIDETGASDGSYDTISYDLVTAGYGGKYYLCKYLGATELKAKFQKIYNYHNVNNIYTAMAGCVAQDITVKRYPDSDEFTASFVEDSLKIKEGEENSGLCYGSIKTEPYDDTKYTYTLTNGSESFCKVLTAPVSEVTFNYGQIYKSNTLFVIRRAKDNSGDYSFAYIEKEINTQSVKLDTLAPRLTAVSNGGNTYYRAAYSYDGRYAICKKPEDTMSLETSTLQGAGIFTNPDGTHPVTCWWKELVSSDFYAHSTTKHKVPYTEIKEYELENMHKQKTYAVDFAAADVPYTMPRNQFTTNFYATYGSGWKYSDSNWTSYVSTFDWGVFLKDFPDKKNILLCMEVKDNNENYLRYGSAWVVRDTIKQPVKVTVSGSNAIFDVSENKKCDYNTFAASYFDTSTNKWVLYSYSAEETVIPKATSKTVSVKSSSLFHKVVARGWYIDETYKWNNDVRMEPHYYETYFYGSNKTCYLKNRIEGSKGVSILCDAPVLVQVICSSVGYDTDIYEWIRRGEITEEKVFNNSFTIAPDTSKIPDGDKYVVIAHYADGDTDISSVFTK